MTPSETPRAATGLAMLGGPAVVCTDEWCAAPAAPNDGSEDVAVRNDQPVDSRPDPAR